MKYWKTKNQVKIWFPLALMFILNACQQSPQPRADKGHTGVITGALGAELSESPESQPYAKASGNIALVVEEQILNKTNWRRLIVSDGSYGWTSQFFSQLHPAMIAPQSEPFALKGKSPDDAAFEESPEIAVSLKDFGSVEGASRTSRPAYPQDMMVPPKLSRTLLPWLQLRFGPAEGYAAIPWLSIQWSSAAKEQVDLNSALRDFSADGVVIGPFLAQLRPALGSLAPRAGDPLFVPGVDHKAPATKPSPSGFDKAEMLVRNGTAQLVVFSMGPARVFTFSDRGNVVRLLIEEDNPFISRAEIRDLSSDGKPEWLLELVSTYGDGYYSALWVVKGATQGKTPAIDQIPLSRSSSEGQGQAADSTWWVSPENKIWVMIAGNSATTIASYSYKDGKLAANRADADQIPVVVLAGAKELQRAGQARLEANRTSNVAGLFTVRNGDDVSFMVGRPFETETAARAFLQAHSGAKLIFVAPAKVTRATTR